MVAIKISALLLASATLLNASPCPFGKLYEEGKLSDAEAAQFLAARSDKEAAVEHMMSEVAKRDLEHEKQEKVYKRQLLSGLLPLGGGLLGGVLQPFSGVLAGLDVPVPQETGEVLIPDAAHPFQWPQTTDVRGMCPTLNTMANHGYIARDGITNFAEAANACQITLGFGYDTCTFLSALGLLAGGDLASGKYSIGGADSRVPNTLGPALGISHHGPCKYLFEILNFFNFFTFDQVSSTNTSTVEIDQSISRSDTYFGNNANFNLTRFRRLAAIAEENGSQFGVDTFNAERQITYQESKDNNPEFDAGAKHLVRGNLPSCRLVNLGANFNFRPSPSLSASSSTAPSPTAPTRPTQTTPTSHPSTSTKPSPTSGSAAGLRTLSPTSPTTSSHSIS